MADQNELRIRSVEITPHSLWGTKAKILATWSDGSTTLLFEYFDDELHFTPKEFTGLTRQQAAELFLRKDAEYLRS